MSVQTAAVTPPSPGSPTQGTAATMHARRLPAGAKWGLLAAAAVVALGLSVGVFHQSFSPANLLGTTLTILAIGALVYCVGIYALAAPIEGTRYAADRLVTGVVATFFLFALVPLVSVICTVLAKGLKRFDAEFFTYSMSGVISEGGGAYHAIMGSLIVTALATLISVPIGILAAIYLVEYGNNGPIARGLTFFVDVMTGIPSIVAGLFAAAVFALFVDISFRAGIIGAVALSVLMIPIVVKSTEEMLRIVPRDLREASYALGVPKWLTIVKVVLPTAIAGIATGVTLSIARVMGETAPLLVTMGLAPITNTNPFDGRMATLPVFAYLSYASPGAFPEPSVDRAWAAALTLIVIVMVLNVVARVIAKAFAPKTR